MKMCTSVSQTPAGCRGGAFWKRSPAAGGGGAGASINPVGFLVVKGENLELIKLDTMQGNVSIKGMVKSMTYIEDVKVKDKEQGIFNRLFK